MFERSWIDDIEMRGRNGADTQSLFAQKTEGC